MKRVLFYVHSFRHQNQCHIHNFKFYMKSKFTAFTYNTSVCITPKLKKKKSFIIVIILIVFAVITSGFLQSSTN